MMSPTMLLLQGQTAIFKWHLPSNCSHSRNPFRSSKIRFLSLSGGSDREITVTRGWANMTNLDWSVDENALYCGSQSSRSSTLLYVDLKGNARVLWQYRSGGGLAGIPSPDGRYIAINTPVTSSNVWMVEGF